MRSLIARKIACVALVAAGAATVSAAGSDLKITIQSPQHSIKNGETFPVNTTIENVSGKDQTIQVWSCSYDAQWKSDSPYAKAVEYVCTRNGIKPIKLKPGEHWSRSLDVRVTVPARKLVMRLLTFRLAFLDAQEVAGKIDWSKALWSNPVTVNIRE